MARFYLFLVFVFAAIFANAQTITISQITGGVSTSPLASGSTDVAILGILFDKSSGGMCELDAFTVDLSINPAGVFTNPRLYRSSDNNFDGVGSEALVSTGSIAGNTFVFDETATFITDFGGSSSQIDRFIFVVVDVAAGLNASSPSIQPSLVDTNVTSAGCTVNAGTVTGTNFSFLGLTIGSLNAGANNVAGDPLIAGSTGQAVFGFSLTSNGSQTVSVVNVQLTTDPATKFSGYSLVKSTDVNFASAGDNSTVGGLTFTPSATQVAITGLSQSITSTASNYFLVANVNPAVTGATTNIQASLVAANVIVNTGGKEGTSTGTDYSFTTATTTIGSLNAGANNVATSPITTGATGQAVFGFSLTSNGTQTATAVNVQFTADPTLSKYSNYSLVKSVDANFASSGDNSTVGGLTFTPSATEVVITGLSQTITTTASNYFLVVDVDAAATGNIQATLGNTNVTLSAGSLAGSSTGTNYSFTPLTATIGSLNAPANNVASSPIVAGGTGKAVFGFSLSSNGAQTATAVNIQFSANPTLMKYSNYSLVKSTDADFATSGNNTTLPGLTFTPSATQVAITGLTEALTGVASNYFLVVDVDPAVTGTIQASLANSNVTVVTGIVAGSATGTNYSFAPLTATITSLNAGANNVAASPLEAGSSGQAIFGFAIGSNGSQMVSQINIQLSGDPAGRWSSFSLISSTDADFGTAGNNTVVPTSALVVTGAAPFEVQITPTTPLDITTAKNLFLIADVNAGLTSATPAIQATIGIANVTVSAGVKTGSANGTSYTFDTSQNTSITVNYVGQTSIDLGEYSDQADDMTQGTSQRIFAIDITDGDSDSHSTTITSLAFQLTNFANLNNIALYDGSTEILELDVATSIVGNVITFSPLSYVVADGSTGTPNTKTLDIRVTFAPTVTDNQTISVVLNSAIALNTGSGLATLGSVQTGGGKNPINVVSTEMLFTAITPVIIPSTNFGLTVLATDNLGNQDLNTTGNVTLSKQSGPGVVSSSDPGGLTRAFVAGSVSWSQLQATLAGNYMIRANHGSLPNKDEPITVTSLGAQITGPSNQVFCFGGTYAPLSTITISESDPSDFSAGNGQSYSFILPSGFEFNTGLSPTPTETGSNVSGLTAITYLSSSIARFTYDVSAINSTDAIIISGLEVRYTGSAPVSNLDIFRIGGTAVQEGNSDSDANSHGTLDAAQSGTPVSFTVQEQAGEPTVNPNETQFSVNSTSILLNGSPAGGVFSGNGVSYNMGLSSYVFSPNGVGTGTYVVTYSYTEPASPNCVVSTNKSFTVYSSVIGNLSLVYCDNGTPTGPLTVTQAQIDAFYSSNPPGTYVLYDYVYYNTSSGYIPITDPSNGSFSMPSNVTFNPSLSQYAASMATFGRVYVYYRVALAVTPGVLFGFAQLQTPIINPAPTADFTIPSFTFCGDDAPVALTDNSVTAGSGVFSGLGVSGTNFAPATAGAPSTPTITYTYTGSGNGCVSVVNKMVSVFTRPSAPPSVDITSGITQSVCVGGTSVTFDTAPATWASTTYKWYDNVGLSGIPVSGNAYTPSTPTPFDTSTPGTTNFFVTRTINGCESLVGLQLNAVVNAPAVAEAGNQSAICEGGDLVLSTLSPSIGGGLDGNWSVVGGTTGQFLDAGGNDITIGGNGQFSIAAKYAASAADIINGSLLLRLTTDDPDGPGGPCPVATDDVLITINSTPSQPLANQPAPYCVGATIADLTASGSSLRWYNNDPGLGSAVLLHSGSTPFDTGVTSGTPQVTDFFVTQSLLGCEGAASQVDIIVNPVPAAAFSISSFCLGDQTSFIDNSTISAGSIVEWAWNFADGDNLASTSGTIPAGTHNGRTTGTANNPLHTYASTGSRIVTMIAKSDQNCSSTVQQNIEIGQYPVTNFGQQFLCDGDVTQFTSSAGTGFTGTIQTVDWDFGDGTMSSMANPSHQYSSQGTYNVQLTLTTDLACSNTITKPVSILPYVQAFPYRTSFESGADGWVAESYSDPSQTMLSWGLTSPAGQIINSASDGANAWFAHNNGIGTYFPNERSALNTPCFDMTQIGRPVISFDHWGNTDQGSDGVYMEVSTDGGLTWQILGGLNTGLNWYNRIAINGLTVQNSVGQSVFQVGWSGDTQDVNESDGWTPSKFSLDNFTSFAKVRFRYVFGSNPDNPAGSILDGFAMDDFAIESRNRTILAENFTNGAASGASNNATAFQSFNNGVSVNELVRIQYHTSIGGTDPLHLDNPEAPNARAAFYGVTNSFRGYIDGSSDGAFGQPWASTTYDSRTLVASPLEISITSPATPAGTFNVEAIINAIDDLKAGQYTVQVAIVEKQVGSNAFVLRELLPDASGTPLTSLTNLSQQTISVSTELTNIADPNEIAVIVFVQQMTGQKEVLQAKLLDGIPPPAIITGLEFKAYGDLIGAHPNPANQELTVQLPTPAIQDTPIRLVDQVGKIVHDTFIPMGSASKTLSTSDLAGGVYLLQIDSGGGKIAHRRIMVVHK